MSISDDDMLDELLAHRLIEPCSDGSTYGLGIWHSTYRLALTRLS